MDLQSLTLLVEILDGPPGAEAYLLNPGDPGLIRQLESLSAETASARPMPGKTTIYFVYKRSWENIVADARAFQVEISA